jgi:hypothetical protein
MARQPRSFAGGLRFAAALTLAAGVGGAAVAAPSWVRNALSFGHADDPLHATPTVARFDIEAGGAFTLDRSHHGALLKFEDSPEVWILTESRGPRGDIIYKNDVGEPMLRATKLGGMTVFTSHHPWGAAASLAGAAPALRQSTIGPAALYQRLIQASVRCTHAVHHLVAVEAPNTGPKSDSLVADAAAVTVDAVIALASQASGRAAEARLARIVVYVGSRPAADMRRGVLFVTVAQGEGLGAHPSSLRIEQVLAGAP